jgi:hypothetical protein
MLALISVTISFMNNKNRKGLIWNPGEPRIYSLPLGTWSVKNHPLGPSRTPGFHISPFLFLLFINDIVTDIKASIKLFADDTSLYVTVDTPQSAADIINRDLEKIHQYVLDINVFNVQVLSSRFEWVTGTCEQGPMVPLIVHLPFFF